MPNVPQPLLDEFGKAVKLARSKRGWELNDLANRIAEMEAGRPGQKAKAPARSFLSDFEKGKRSISPPTVGKLIHSLDLPESWLYQFLAAAPDEADEVMQTDRDVDRLLRMAQADPAAPPTPEELLLGLARDYAGGDYLDVQTAYAGLRGALQADAEMRAKRDRPHNMDDRLTAILLRVNELNSFDRREEADQIIEEAIKAKEAELEALHDAALLQDRLRNRPAAAAARMIVTLKAQAPAGGVFNATRRLIIETRERGERQGDPYDLSLALELAKANHARAKGAEVPFALNDLGNCHFALGKRQSGNRHLIAACKCFTEALRLTKRYREPESWAGRQSNLGSVLRILGDREGDPARLREAINAYRAALTVRTPEAAPMAWATTQNNLGTVLQSLGEREGDPARLHEAINAYRAALAVHTPEVAPMDWAMTQNYLGLSLRWLGTLERTPDPLTAARGAFDACLTVHTRQDAPFLWAVTQRNLADLALAWHDLDARPAHLDAAQAHLDAARAVFADPENPHQLAECDRLQVLIDSARAVPAPPRPPDKP